MTTLKQLQSCSVHILHALATGRAPGSVRRAEDETNIFEPGYFLFSRIVADLQQSIRNRRPAQVALSPRSSILLHRIDSKCQHSFHSQSVRACISPCPESTFPANHARAQNDQVERMIAPVLLEELFLSNFRKRVGISS